ncbi:MAG: hypothetical protein BM565_01495 [Gammaproteobacteria bacterium MedPE]|nr:MAG: hypothetical protein BM565_01495 [Gammaproteobacteria bacterium MedPE]
MKITKTIKLSALTCALGMSSIAHADLIITEYIEGGGNNKVVELTNRGGATLDLTGYVLNLHSNGAVEAKNPQALTGSLDAGKSLVIYNKDATDAFKKPAPQGIESTVTWFNGDDALTLTLNGVVVDSFGQVGNDPGSSWNGENGFATKDKTLRRLENVTTGDSVVDDAFPGDTVQWQVFDKDTSDGLGCDGVSACDGSTSPTPTPTPTPTPVENLPTAESPLIFSEYVEGGGNNKAIEIANTSDVAVNLTGYKVSIHSNGAGFNDAGSTYELTGSLEPKATFVLYNTGADREFQILNGAESRVTWFNGDDALLLTLNDEIVDSFGQLGTDPGDSWSNGDFNSKDKTLRRKNTVTAGDKIPGDEYPGAGVSEWIVLDKDTSNGLGCIGEGECTGVELIPEPTADECTNCPDLAKVTKQEDYKENTYYANALTAASGELRAAINTDISKNHKKLTYSEVWTVVTHSDQDPTDDGKVALIYKGTSIGKGLNAGLKGNGGDNWNREHVWAKSHGFPEQNQYAYTDAHHLRPADASINSARSNLDFDLGGEPITEAPENKKDGDSFEPRDQMKGDVARMLFYMDVRYEGATADNTPNLVLVDRVGTANGSPELGKLCTLYTWHQEDPVSDFERNRNNVVFEFQGNRNPFIDRPEWVKEVFGAACGDAPVVNTKPTAEITAAATVKEGESVQVSVAATDAQDDTLTYTWSEVTTVGVTLSATDSAQIMMTAPEVDSDTTVTLQVVVNDGELETTAEVTLTIEADVNTAPTAEITAAATVQEGESLQVSVAATDAQDDTLTYTWSEVTNVGVTLSATDTAQITVTAPDVSSDTVVTLQVVVSDGELETKSEVSLTVEAKKSSSGGLGVITLALLGLVSLSRRRLISE